MAKSKKQLADEAYMRSEEQLAGRAPVPEGVIPGQLSIDGSVAGASGYEVPHPISGVPDSCPRCRAAMTVVYGGSWTPMYRLDDESEGRLQCGYCAHVVTVTLRTHAEVRAERRRTVGRQDRIEKALKPKRERGAG